MGLARVLSRSPDILWFQTTAISAPGLNLVREFETAGALSRSPCPRRFS